VTTLPLNESVTGFTDFFGGATLKIGPTAHGITWKPAVASVRAATANLDGLCRIYVGHTATTENFVDATYTGSSGDSTNNLGSMGCEIWLGNYAHAVWEGADPGTQVTLVVTGSQELN
jgi:hypothetical protein